MSSRQTLIAVSIMLPMLALAAFITLTAPASKSAKELYACFYETPDTVLCTGSDNGESVQFSTSPDDPRLTDGTHEVVWSDNPDAN